MRQNVSHTNKSLGFTLIELMLSIAVIGLLAGLSLPVYASFNNRNNLDLTTQSVATLLRRAETYSRGAKSDSQWGVEIQSSKATLFLGSNFSSRDVTYDEEVTTPSSIALSSLSEVLFSKLDGMPTTTGSVTVSLTNGVSETRTITINAKGVINY